MKATIPVTQIALFQDKAQDGKLRMTDAANTKTLLRIIQSILSHKAEPFKLWLAKISHERIQEIEDPELATKRTRDLYKAKGYSEPWIDKRMRSIATLTAEISKATFGLTPTEYTQSV